jgi:hypothetical protein
MGDYESENIELHILQVPNVLPCYFENFNSADMPDTGMSHTDGKMSPSVRFTTQHEAPSQYNYMKFF